MPGPPPIHRKRRELGDQAEIRKEKQVLKTQKLNGGSDETRTRDLLRDRQVKSFFQLHCFHPFPPIINNLGYLLSLSQQPHSLPNIGF